MLNQIKFPIHIVCNKHSVYSGKCLVASTIMIYMTNILNAKFHSMSATIIIMIRLFSVGFFSFKFCLLLVDRDTNETQIYVTVPVFFLQNCMFLYRKHWCLWVERFAGTVALRHDETSSSASVTWWNRMCMILGKFDKMFTKLCDFLICCFFCHHSPISGM